MTDGQARHTAAERKRVNMSQVLDSLRAAIEAGKTSMAPTEYGDYRGRDFRLKYAERDVRDLSIEMLRECLSLLLNCDLSIKLSGGENMDRIALEKLFAQLLYVAHRGSVA